VIGRASVVRLSLKRLVASVGVSLGACVRHLAGRSRRLAAHLSVLALAIGASTAAAQYLRRFPFDQIKCGSASERCQRRSHRARHAQPRTHWA
jgi:hypothetical protein